MFPFAKHYGRTGIQYQPFNTAYQLAALKREHPEQLEQAARLLMIPDYFHYLLTGRMVNEYTNATSTALVGAESRTWDDELIDVYKRQGMYTAWQGPHWRTAAGLIWSLTAPP